MRAPLSFSLLPIVCLALHTGCGSSSGNDGDQKPLTDAGSFDREIDGSQCAATTQSAADEGANHVQTCAPVTYVSNPPASGNHYGDYPAFGVYETALPRGFWVHSLEHGSIVISHNCTDCDAELARAKSFVTALAPDSFCARQGYTVPRVILTPDPKLDVRWAASSWGFTLRADCFEEAPLKSFIDEHIGNAPENICSFAFDPRKADGSLDIPANCE